MNKKIALLCILFFLFVGIFPSYADNNCKIDSVIDTKTMTNIKSFMKTQIEKNNFGIDDTSIAVSSISCDGNSNHDYIVYVYGNLWCGSGGCDMFVLEELNNSFSIKGKMTVVKLPIILLGTSKFGRPDIAVTITDINVNSVKSVLKFSGKKYPSNPTLQSVEKRKNVKGAVVFSEPLHGFYLFE